MPATFYAARFMQRVVAISSLLLVFGIHSSAMAAVGGEEDVPSRYQGDLFLDGSRCSFTIELDRVLFLVATVADRYRIVPVAVECEGTNVALSSTDDRFETADGAAGILSLQRFDSQVWDGFDASIRRMLAYPQKIEARKRQVFFAYFRVDDIHGLPYEFSFTIASIAETVYLRLPPPTAS